MPLRQLTPTNLTISDKVICGFDRALRSLTNGTQAASRPSPADDCLENGELSESERKHSAGLMRVNHSGEVCAQALYQGQALGAKLPKIREKMEEAADEEIDHLAWCEQRINDLGERPSALNPLWYGLSFGIGYSAGLISDRLSLGFVAATEDQVCDHLRKHLKSLPEQDEKSKAVVEQMLIDEEKHATTALEAGGVVFPEVVKAGMTKVSKVMTELSYRI